MAIHLHRLGPGVPWSIAAACLVSACGGGDEPAAARESAAVAASPTICAARSNNTFEKLLECVTLDGVRAHQAEFQAIADANGGTRAAGTPGYEASVSYVVEKLTAAGYNVTLNPFPFVFVPPALLQQLTPVNATYETGSFTGTGYGDVTAAVVPVDINLTPPRASTSRIASSVFVPV